MWRVNYWVGNKYFTKTKNKTNRREKTSQKKSSYQYAVHVHSTEDYGTRISKISNLCLCANSPFLHFNFGHISIDFPPTICLSLFKTWPRILNIYVADARYSTTSIRAALNWTLGVLPAGIAAIFHCRCWYTFFSTILFALNAMILHISRLNGVLEKNIYLCLSVLHRTRIRK